MENRLVAIGLDRLDRLEIDPKTNDLYWDRRKVKTKIELDWLILVPAWTVSMSTLAMSVFVALDFYLKHLTE